MAVRVVQGFVVSRFTGQNVKVKAILMADKDDIRAGEGDLADVLESLELHATAGDSSTVTLALRASEEAETSTPYEFSVTSFAVKQDKLQVVLEAMVDDIGVDVLASLGVHAAAEGDQRLVELTMQRPE